MARGAILWGERGECDRVGLLVPFLVHADEPPPPLGRCSVHPPELPPSWKERPGPRCSEPRTHSRRRSTNCGGRDPVGSGGSPISGSHQRRPASVLPHANASRDPLLANYKGTFAPMEACAAAFKVHLPASGLARLQPPLNRWHAAESVACRRTGDRQHPPVTGSTWLTVNLGRAAGHPAGADGGIRLPIRSKGTRPRGRRGAQRAGIHPCLASATKTTWMRVREADTHAFRTTFAEWAPP
jgi:hypothetical protein